MIALDTVQSRLVAPHPPPEHEESAQEQDPGYSAQATTDDGSDVITTRGCSTRTVFPGSGGRRVLNIIMIKSV